ncbi:CYFA0S01e19064g1_1 [Cyberlindnera fabianii]|uniref:CYFA0S01e19064g1_1 n=1 Tax=Cyberlindnera fabianii TaxID=36022 RepID=A0A061AK09_CYBFA|nr:CYFA0S01e19064g1_1 [Cyberlindnera fabianii]
MVSDNLTALNSLSKRFPKDKLYQSVPVPGSKEPGFSPVYRNAAHPDGTIPYVAPGLSTLHELFENAVELFGDSDCLGERKRRADGSIDNFYTYESYSRIDQRRLSIASGIIQLTMGHPSFKKTESSIGADGKPKFVVAVSGVNCVEMILTDLATRSFSIPNTGLYESLSETAAHHILSLSESPVVVINKGLLPKFLRIKKMGLPYFFLAITFEEHTQADAAMIKEAKDLGIDVLAFSSVEKHGEKNPLAKDFNLPKPDTLYTLAFTSGTTGMPKGVYLTHANACANVTGFIIHCPRPAVGLSPEHEADFSYNKDAKGRQLRSLCFLPLLHNLEKSVTNFELSYGIALALPSKPGTQTLFEDLQLINPSLFTGVPRVFGVIESKMKQYISTLPSGSDIPTEVRKHFGFTNLSYFMCASAPISKESIIFFKQTLKCGFMNSYGATEAFSVISFSNPYHVLSGSSGPGSVGTEIRLKDVPEMGYTSADKPHARGEVLMRGHCLFSHYYKNEEATRSTIDPDGWYHSGDVAAMDEDGNLFIIDRVKNFFKLAQGEYVTPEKVETVYLSKNPVLTQLFVHGDSYTNFLIGIAGVDLALLRRNLSALGLECKEWADEDLLALLKVPRVKTMILNELNKNLRDTGLQGFEKLHNLHFELQPLTIENESLTPSYKLKRASAKKVHSNKLEELYKEGSLIKRHKL